MQANELGKVARGIGTAIGVTSGVALVVGGAGTAQAGDPVTERCIDTIGLPSNDESDTWDLDTWETYLSTCEADFGEGKLIVDVVTEEGEPVLASVDLQTIVDAFDFGYADPERDALKARFDPLCDLRYDDWGRDFLENFEEEDFRTGEPVAGRRVRVLRLLGDRDPATGDGMVLYEIQPNEMLFTWFCNADNDQLRMLPVADVGGGYELRAQTNPTFTGLDDTEEGDITRVQVVVSLRAVETTTTSTTTSTTSTTTPPVEESTTTTSLAAAPPITPAPTAPPTTVPLVPALPETGRSSGTAALAALTLVAGLGCTLLARRRMS